ncbi:hypothetical protein LJC47_01790 [Desulfosarcina sp. OttesenSCG-928-B08]|nr:hypothetical protein [Desulfosarcina sp. OttesenSCG-928-B08]
MGQVFSTSGKRLNGFLGHNKRHLSLQSHIHREKIRLRHGDVYGIAVSIKCFFEKSHLLEIATHILLQKGTRLHGKTTKKILF